MSVANWNDTHAIRTNARVREVEGLITKLNAELAQLPAKYVVSTDSRKIELIEVPSEDEGH